MPAGLRWSKTGAHWVVDESTRDEKTYDDNFDPKAWGLLISYWRYYPDKFLDMMEGPSTKYELQLIQRIIIRAVLRYSQVFDSASRGTTKSFCMLSSKEVEGLLYPGVDTQYVGPSKEQLADILRPQNIDEIVDDCSEDPRVRIRFKLKMKNEI